MGIAEFPSPAHALHLSDFLSAENDYVGSLFVKPVLMSEVSYPSKDHSQPQPVRSLDDLLIAHRASGLDNRGSPRSGDLLDAVREGKESIGGGHRPLQRQLRLHGAELARIDAAHLSRADAHRLPVAGVENGVRLHVLANLPREKE